MADFLNTADCKTGFPHVQKFGLNPEVDTASVPEDVASMGGFLDDSLITPPFSLSSTSANDSATGIGIQQIFAEGIDLNGNYKSDTFELNGITPINVSGFFFINRAYGTRWGSSGFNQGDINFIDSAGSPQTIGQIPISTVSPGFGFGQTLQAMFCIPLDWGPMVMTNRWVAVGKQLATQAAVVIATNLHRGLHPTAGFRVSATGEANTQGTNFLSQNLDSCGLFEPLTIIRLAVLEVTSNNTRVSGGFGLSKA